MLKVLGMKQSMETFENCLLPIDSRPLALRLYPSELYFLCNFS
jgi:hypothetical protein